MDYMGQTVFRFIGLLKIFRRRKGVLYEKINF